MTPYCKKYFSLKEKKKIIDFCKEEGLNYEAFRSAKRRYIQEGSLKEMKSDLLAPVVVASTESVDSYSSILSNIKTESNLENITICYTNGVLLTLPSADISTVAKLINLQ